MVGPEHDFGGEIGVRKTICLRDFLLVEGITLKGMKEMDAVRKANGLPAIPARPKSSRKRGVLWGRFRKAGRWTNDL
jgi:hypothetical protein